LKPKKTPYLQTPDVQPNDRKGFAGVLGGKLRFLVVFAVIYGLVFINYIDIASSGLVYGYHLWLVLMYFLPFVGFSMLSLKNWKLTVGLGLIASLMNDVFYHFMQYLVGLPTNLSRSYDLWLIPQNALLFHMNLGFADVQVMSWMMALSIYLRIAVVVGLLWNWNLAGKSPMVRNEEATPRLGLGGLNRIPSRIKRLHKPHSIKNFAKKKASTKMLGD
jgi:hypothetical protein